MNDIITVILTSAGSVITLFILTKLIGNKQMSQLDMFDYINGITIGSIAAEMATNIEGDFWLPLVAMVIYTSVVLLISFIAKHSLAARRFLEGRSLILMDNGKLFRKNFSKANLDINSFLTQCRIQGYFNLSDIQTAFLEENGKISILPKDAARPVTPKDLDIPVKQSCILFTYILDGQILMDNLEIAGKDMNWLNGQLNSHNVKIKDVFLATDDGNGQLLVYKKNSETPQNDFFQ